jgi:hypothetical protein
MNDGKANGKGKGRATTQETEEAAPSNDSSNSKSLFSRITASATGLTRSTFRAPTANELSDQAATAQASSGKGQPLSSNGNGSSTWAENSKIPYHANHDHPSGTGSSCLGNGHHEQHIQHSEKEFSSFLDGIDSFTPSEKVVPAPNRRLDEAWENSHTAGHLHESGVPQRTVAEQEINDGDDVLAILSSSTAFEQEFEPPLEDEDYDWGLSKDQLTQHRAMTKEIFPPPEAHLSVAVEHPLNLNPTFEGETIEAREHWREQWEGVLTRYTDEVWGGLLPLVKQAREEIEEMRNVGTVREKPTALRRLEAILGHLQKR